MSLPVFVLDTLDPGAQIVELSGPEGRHAVTVKRIGVGERVEIVDARGTRAEVRVTEVGGKDRLVGEVLAVRHEPRPVPEVTVVQAIPKSPHAELAVDLLTQAGADRIVAWQAARSVARWVKPSSTLPAAASGASDGALPEDSLPPAGGNPKAQKALAKWTDRAREAAKQSRRAWLPELHGPVTTGELVGWLSGQGPETVIAILHEDARDKLTTLPVAGATKVVLVVGPEGGIAAEELAKLESAGGRPVTLGPLVARASAAGAFGVAALGAVTERW